MDYKNYYKAKKDFWQNKRVIYGGKEYTVVDVDYNIGLLIDKPAKFTNTTAVSENDVRIVG